MVEGLEAVHHRFADLSRFDLVALGLEAALNAADEPFDLLGRDVALAGRMADRSGELVAVERLALAILLDHREVAQLDPLEGREAGDACLVRTRGADRGAVFVRPAVLNLAVCVRAEGTAHALSLIDRE